MNTIPEYLFVSARGAVSIGNGRFLQPGSKVKWRGLLTEERVGQLMEQGWLATSASQASRTRPGAAITGAGKLPAIGTSDPEVARSGREKGNSEVQEGFTGGRESRETEQALADLAKEQEARRGKHGDPEPQPPKSGPAAPDAMVDGFVYDPDGLIGKPADELRQMVLAVDPEMEIDGLDEGDLISILSADFEPSEEVEVPADENEGFRQVRREG